MQLRDRPVEALLGKFGNRFEQRRRFKREVVRLGTVGLVGSQGSPGFIPRLSSQALTQIAKSAIRGG